MDDGYRSSRSWPWGGCGAEVKWLTSDTKVPGLVPVFPALVLSVLGQNPT